MMYFSCNVCTSFMVILYFFAVISQENLTFQELCKESYRLISIVDDKYKPNFISKLETATETTFACILLPSEDLLTKLLHIASKVHKHNVMY